MKRFFKMLFNTRRFGAIRHLIDRKNMQIRAEREKYQAERAVNSILTAYIFYLASKYGTLRIPRAEISSALGRHTVIAYSDGDDYVINVRDIVDSEEVDARGEAGDI